MPVGQKHPDERREYREPITGTKVIQLTQGPGDDYHLYFTATSFLADGRRIAFCSDRSGRLDLYTLDLRTGEICQVTDEGVPPYGSVLDIAANVAYYRTDREIRKVDVDTGNADTLCEMPEGFITHGLGLGGNGRYLIFGYTERKLDFITSTSSRNLVKGVHSDTSEWGFSMPRTVLMSWDLHKNMPEAIWGEHRLLGHAQLSPTNSDIVMYCHEGGTVETRMWAVQRPEVRKKKPWSPYPEPDGWRAVHEYFCRDGRIAFQLDDERNGGVGFKTAPDELPDAICYQAFVDPDGDNFRKYRLPGPRPGHFFCHEESGPAVGDRNPLGKDLADINGGMVLMRHDADSSEVLCEPLCRHETSWLTQPSHPHPILSPDGEWALFSSDRDGPCNIYMVSIGDAAAKLGF